MKPSDYNTSKFPFSAKMSSDNEPLLGFGVLVDKQDKLQICAKSGSSYTFQQLSDYTLGEGNYLIGRPNLDKGNTAPQLILIPGMTYDPKVGGNITWCDWEWPRECVSIKEAYPEFEQWIKKPAFDWTKNKVDSKVTKK